MIQPPVLVKDTLLSPLTNPTNSSQSDTPPSKIPNSCNIQEMVVMSDSAKPTN